MCMYGFPRPQRIPKMRIITTTTTTTKKGSLGIQKPTRSSVYT